MNNRFTKFYLTKAILIISIIVCSLPFENTWAQWSTNPYLNNPVCTEASTQAKPVIITDGHGGSIIAWYDERAGFPDGNIYAQRLDSTGLAKWAINGISICSAPSLQAQLAIVSDGKGGAIITWADLRNLTDLYPNNIDIYAQRVNGDGIVQWTLDGVAICTAQDEQSYPKITTDGNGGAIFAWADHRRQDVNLPDIYAQGINADGTLKWSEVAVCTNIEGQVQPAIVSDSSGGAYIVWKDARNQSDGTSASDIYGQHIGSNGSIQWAADGISICKAYRVQENPVLTSDGSGGAIITWQDERNLNDSFPNNVDIYAQRINANGVAQWTANGIPICTDKDKQLFEQITSDGSGGAIITWESASGYGNAAVSRIYFQRVNSSGTVLWMNNGIPMGGGDNVNPLIVSDGTGGAFLILEKNIGGIGGYSDIYAQHIDANGLELWRPFGGVIVSNAYGNQSNSGFIPDNRGGIIVAWDDSRNTLGDIFAQHLKADGTLGGGSAVANQSITFNAIPAKAFSEISFIPNASSSSGLPLTFTSSNASVATISGNTVTFIGVGTSTITAYQSGNVNFHEAPPISQLLSVNKGIQFITFNTISSKTLGDAPFTLTASASSNLPISYSSTSDKITISNGEVTLLKAGSVTIKAEQAGDNNFEPAAFTVQTFCINPPKPTIQVSGSSSSPLLTSSSSTGNQWYKDGMIVSGETNTTLNITSSGIYTLVVKADNCSSEPSSGVNLVITGLEEFHNSAVTVYPNPVDHDLTVDVSSLSSQSPIVVSLLDASGRTLETTSGNGVITLSMKNYGSSVYILQISYDGNRITKQIIKK